MTTYVKLVQYRGLWRFEIKPEVPAFGPKEWKTPEEARAFLEGANLKCCHRWKEGAKPRRERKAKCTT